VGIRDKGRELAIKRCGARGLTGRPTKPQHDASKTAAQDQVAPNGGLRELADFGEMLSH